MSRRPLPRTGNMQVAHDKCKGTYVPIGRSLTTISLEWIYTGDCWKASEALGDCEEKLSKERDWVSYRKGRPGLSL